MAPYPAPPPPSSSSSTLVIVLVVVGGVVFVIFLGLVVLVFFGVRAATMRALAARDDGGSAGGPRAPLVSGGERVTWDASNSISVVPVDVNGDGLEDFVGMYRTTGGDPQEIYAGAFDGKSFARLWSAGPYGTVAQAAAASRIGVAAGAVVVADFRGAVHVLDLRTGKERARLSLTDRAASVCSPSDARAQAYVEVVDHQNVVVDVSAGTLTPTPARPAWCGPKDAVYCEGIAAGGSCAAPMEDVARLAPAGLLPVTLATSGTHGVALGLKTAGTASSLLLGFDPTTFAVRWRASVAPDPTLESPGVPGLVSLANGRVYTSYSTTAPEQTHLAVFDAETGARVLDVALPHTMTSSTAGPIVPTATRIYVPHWVWLEVLDGKTGAVVGSVGTWP